jgi:hypothetical protein
MARTPTQKELAAFVVGHGIVDFVSGGKLSLIERNAIWKAVKKLGPAAVTTTGRLAGTAAMGAARALPAVARGAKFITMRHPVIFGAVVTYEVVKNREQIAQLAREGWDVVQDAREMRREYIAERPDEFVDLPFIGPVRPLGVPFQTKLAKRRKSTYNSAVSKGIKALKKSTSYGKRGVLNTPKKAFGFVARTVSKLRKGKKVPSKGASGVVKRSLGNIKITVRKP